MSRISAATAVPTCRPSILACLSAIVPMKASYSVVIWTACKGTRATNTSRAAVATAASVEAPAVLGPKP
jgi:hypothetical protein